MSRAYIIYFLMFVGAIAGLWVILTVGAAMKAPDDLAGEWTVTWEGTPPAEVRDGTMRVSQSGRYFVVRFSAGRAMRFTLRPVWQGARDGRILQMELDGEVWKLDLQGAIPIGQSPRVGEMRLKLSGPSEHAGIARRVGSLATT